MDNLELIQEQELYNNNLELIRLLNIAIFECNNIRNTISSINQK